jgi:glutamate-1-semialdehyde 2,1-aminomutase
MAIQTSPPGTFPTPGRSRPPAANPPSQAAAPLPRAATRPPAALPRERQLAAYHRAVQTMPGGADSNFRAWGEDTIYVDRGLGGRVWDLDGTEFVDLRMGYGPAILGHADQRVDDHVSERMRRGVSFSLTSEDEISVAELICEMTFCDMARMTVSGTEATMHAIRIARGFTGRDRIVKFEGQYHGVHDYALISVLPADVTHLGDRDEPVRLAWGRGIPEAIKETVIPAVYNDLDGLRRIFEREGEHIAAVIIEPILGNAQGILPQQGFLDGVRQMTREFGALLIFDEVKTGFRVARGGAAELFGITPDLATYAKAMGNGYPAAAFGGRRDVMGMLPKHVSHGGTYAGNRVAAAAATKVLTIMRDTDALGTVARNGLAMQAGIGEVIDRRGLPHVFTGVPAMFGIMFTDQLPADYRGWAATDHELYDDVARGMFLRGAMPEPDSREPWFICEAHAEGDLIDRAITAFEGSLDCALEARARA